MIMVYFVAESKGAKYGVLSRPQLAQLEKRDNVEYCVLVGRPVTGRMELLGSVFVFLNEIGERVGLYQEVLT